MLPVAMSATDGKWGYPGLPQPAPMPPGWIGSAISSFLAVSNSRAPFSPFEVEKVQPIKHALQFRKAGLSLQRLRPTCALFKPSHVASSTWLC